MKKSIILFITVSTLCLSACKDFLDVKPSNSSDASVTIQTEADAKVMLNGLMRRLISSDYYGRNFLIYGDAKGGDITIVSQGRGLDPLYTFNHTATGNSYSGFWTRMYNTMLQANNIINGIDELEAEGTTINFDTYKGQALTIRALAHFDMVRLYGKSYTDDKDSYGVPVVTKMLAPDAQLSRNSVAETYDQIIKDLKDAEELLPKKKNNGYINYYANKAIQARVYLTMGDFDKALEASETVINSTEYSLYTNEKWVDSWSEQFGDESILELLMEKDQGELGSSSLGYYYLRSGDERAYGNFIASDYYLNLLSEDEEDVRWGIMTDDELGRQGACYKYVGSVDKMGDGKETFTDVNIKVIRLSEIYLIAAEAALKKNSPDKTKAKNYLNEIRKRAPNVELATAANITEEMILNEKSKELICEGQRFFDLIRADKSITFNDEHVGVTMTHREKTIDRSFNKTILPISSTELIANPVLKEQQNPGY